MGKFRKFLYSLLKKEKTMDLANADNKRVIEMYRGGKSMGITHYNDKLL